MSNIKPVGHLLEILVFHALKEKEKYVIKFRMKELLGFGTNEKTLQEIGDDLRLSKERIREIQAKALHKCQMLLRGIQTIDPNYLLNNSGCLSISWSRQADVPQGLRLPSSHDVTTDELMPSRRANAFTVKPKDVLIFRTRTDQGATL